MVGKRRCSAMKRLFFGGADALGTLTIGAFVTSCMAMVRRRGSAPSCTIAGSEMAERGAGELQHLAVGADKARPLPRPDLADFREHHACRTGLGTQRREPVRRDRRDDLVVVATREDGFD